jgi:hypothetical protein
MNAVIDRIIRWIPLNVAEELLGLPQSAVIDLARDDHLQFGKTTDGKLFISAESIDNQIGKISNEEAIRLLSKEKEENSQGKKEIVNLTTAAVKCERSPRTIKNAIRNGELTGKRKSSGRKSPYIISINDLIEWNKKTKTDSALTFKLLNDEVLK